MYSFSINPTNKRNNLNEYPSLQEMQSPSASKTKVSEKSSLLLEGQEAIQDKIVFTGMGFGPEGIPIDVATILLAASEAERCTVLITDQFLKMNGRNHKQCETLTQNLEQTIIAFANVFHLPITTMRSSELMASKEYQELFAATQDVVRERGLERQLEETVPPKYRSRPEALLYPLHEVTCSLRLHALGHATKLGPRTEKPYDSVINAVDSTLSFAYATDALPVRTTKPSPVSHYIPSHRAKGSRIFFDSPEALIEGQLGASNAETLRYFCAVSSEAGRLLWQDLTYSKGTRSVHTACSERAGSFPCH